MIRTTLTDVIAGRNRRGQIAIGLYLVPGFPTWPVSLHAATKAARLGVDFIEFPAINQPTWSARTGTVIAHALTQALRTPADDSRWTTWLALLPIRVAVVYRSAWPHPEEWCMPDSWRTGASGLLLEPNVPDLAAYADVAATFGQPLIVTMDATTASLNDEERLSLRTGGGFVYSAMAPHTGTTACHVAFEKASEVRTERPDLPICYAFGVRTAAQVVALRRNPSCDGVIIGTAALEQLQDGTANFERWLTRIVDAARQPRYPAGPSVMRLAGGSCEH